MSSVGATIEALVVDSELSGLLDENCEVSGQVGRSKKILTEMDSRVLEGVAAGMPTVRLAAVLHLSRGGVEYHVTRLLREFRVTNRTSLVSKAYVNGILEVGAWPPRVVRDFVK